MPGAAPGPFARGTLTDPGAAQLKENALRRCEGLPQSDRIDCEKRVNGQGNSDGSVALSLPPAELGYSAEAIRCLRAVLRGQPVDVIALQREDKVLQYSSDVAGSSSPPR